MKALKLPEYLRERLRENIGTIIEGYDYLSVALETLNVLRGCRLVVAVGDVVCSSLIAVGRVPNVCIIDGKSRRRELGTEVSEELFNVVLHARNPPGYITEEASKKVKESIDGVLESSLKLRVLLIIDGEEDLLALPALLSVRVGDCVTYGIPGRGITVIRVDDEIKDLVRNVLSMFEEVEL